MDNMEKDLAILYNELANKIIAMIPTKWNKVYFLGDVEKGRISCSSIFYYNENENEKKFIRQYDIKYKYNISEDVISKNNWEIQKIM
ncbi:MAG: DUF600 family protein, partial [Firmicutes bacterium]|nr:DUF600 family protein [Bacillota bacterium]